MAKTLRSARLLCSFSFKGSEAALIDGFQKAVVKDSKLAPNYCRILSTGGKGGHYQSFVQRLRGQNTASRLRKKLETEFGEAIRIRKVEPFDDQPTGEQVDAAHVWQHGAFADNRLSENKTAKASSKKRSKKRSDSESSAKSESSSEHDSDGNGGSAAGSDDEAPVQKKQRTDIISPGLRRDLEAISPAADRSTMQELSSEMDTLETAVHEELNELKAEMTAMKAAIAVLPSAREIREVTAYLKERSERKAAAQARAEALAKKAAQAKVDAVAAEKTAAAAPANYAAQVAGKIMKQIAEQETAYAANAAAEAEAEEESEDYDEEDEEATAAADKAA